MYVVAGTGSDTLFVDTKSGKVWASGPADDIEVGSRTVTVDRFGTYCTEKSDCGRGTGPTFTGIIARSMNIFARPATDFVVDRQDDVPICTPAQAAAKRRAVSTGGFYPRCIIE